MRQRFFGGGRTLAEALERGNRTTLADIAKAAGVSLNTVSRALRAPQTVRPELRKKIEAVAAELNYLPNRLAGGLAGGRIPVVGVVITSLFYSEFAATIDALQAGLADAGLNVMLGNSRYDAAEETRLVTAMLSWRPAAILLVGVDHPPPVTELLRRAGVPVIEIWDFADEPIDIAIGMDHRAIGAMQARHLQACGCRQLAFVGALRPNDHRAAKRYEGFADACATPPRRVAEAVGGTPALGEELTRRLIAECPDVDGIATNGDVMAFGVLRALHGRVPDEVAVIGFGDSEAAGCMTPTLSSIRPPRREIGEAAARAILARIDGEDSPSLLFEAEIIERQSTRRSTCETRPA